MAKKERKLKVICTGFLAKGVVLRPGKIFGESALDKDTFDQKVDGKYIIEVK